MGPGLAAFLAELPVSADSVVAIGWATVDLERAAAEIAAIDPGVGPFIVAADDRFLGARCLVGSELPSAPRLVLLEPSTEGRLAATLARYGEGPAVAWITPPDGPWVAGDARPTPGPFGRERPFNAAPAQRPLVLVTGEEPGTIAG